MFSEYKISNRITILFFTILSLIIAILNSVGAFFAVTLLYQTRTEFNDNKYKGPASDDFGTLIYILIGVLITAVVTTILAIYGAVISVHPSWLHRHENSIIPTYAFSQMIQAAILIVTGGYLTEHVSGLQPSFKRYTGNNGILYSSVMCYGGIAQAVYGSLFIFFCITIMLANSVANYCERRQKRVKERRARNSLVELPNV